MPEKTLEVTRNLWFHSGDLAKKDGDGYYYFVDRKKDALKRRGENISSTFLEEDDRDVKMNVSKKGLKGKLAIEVIINDKKYDTGTAYFLPIESKIEVFSASYFEYFSIKRR